MSTSKIKEPVRIRFKNLKSGNKSIYLDIYMKGGTREYKFLNLYLHPEETKEDKIWNRQQLQLANAIKAKYIIQIQNGEHGFKESESKLNMNFIDYCRNIINEYRYNNHNSCAVLLECALKRIIRYKGNRITFGQINKAFLIGFIEFLNTDQRDFDRNSSKEHKSGKLISEDYKFMLFARIMTVLNRAVREDIISKNPGKYIEAGLKPKHIQKNRCYLTLSEIQSIIKTPHRMQNDVKRAFLFCCFCGLRFSDVRKITWQELHKGKDGFIQLETHMKKTRQAIYLPLSANALRWIPPKGNAKDEERIFKNLPKQASHANQTLKTLTRKAGIEKHITFHVARHTFATLTLSFGADIYTVSKLLGHTKVQTTQVYAKIIDENKRKAVNLIPICDID